MKKIPTLFVRTFDDNHSKTITTDITPGLEYIASGSGIPTVKWDGACCAVIGGKLYKRYDAKRGKKPPKGAVPCQEKADPITGHFPHWVLVSQDNPSDKWFREAYYNTLTRPAKTGVFTNALSGLIDATYEAVGPHFQSNPYGLKKDILVQHGTREIYLMNHSFEEIKNYLSENVIEGIVFWYDFEPVCKIKRSDFRFEWPDENIVVLPEF